MLYHNISFSGGEFNYRLEYFSACLLRCTNSHQVAKMLLQYKGVLEDL
jgi:hypothetical protein